MILLFSLFYGTFSHKKNAPIKVKNSIKLIIARKNFTKSLKAKVERGVAALYAKNIASFVASVQIRCIALWLKIY